MNNRSFFRTRLVSASALLAASGAALWFPLGVVAQNAVDQPLSSSNRASNSDGTDSFDGTASGPSDSSSGGAPRTVAPRSRRVPPPNPLVLPPVPRSGSSPGGGDPGGGFDANGFDANGYDVDGYDRDGYNRDGYNRAGYTRDGDFRVPNSLDRSLPDGLNANGYNPDGRDTLNNSRRPPSLVPQQDPENYREPRDPNARGFIRPRPLPYFGYDLFLPARQLIAARRAYLQGRYGTVLPDGSLRLRGTNTRRNNNNASGNSAINGGNSSNGNSSPNGPNSNSDNFRNGDNNSQYGNATGGDFKDQTLDSGNAGFSSAAPDSRDPITGEVIAGGAAAGAFGGANSSRTRRIPPVDDNGVVIPNPPRRNQTNPNSDTTGADGGDNVFPSGNDNGNDNGNGAEVDAYGNPIRTRQNGSNDTGSGANADQTQNGRGNNGNFGNSPSDRNNASNNASINAFSGEVADPLSLLSRNVAASLPANYQLQPGDNLTIRYSALVLPPRTLQERVDSRGGITVEGLYVVVRGLSASGAENALRQRLQRLYRGVELSITLSELRTISVTVSGAAFAPNRYTVPAVASAFNVLYATGGPTFAGSLRDIQVLRGGTEAGTLDIYPLLGKTGGRPGKIRDITLQDGDVIYIPARLSSVSLRGEVRQPAIYELTENEGLADALRFSGGVKPSGVKQTVHIDTIIEGTGRVLRDVDVRDAAAVKQIPVYDGDTVGVSSVREILSNRVTIRGAVEQPTDYALTPGMRVSDLLDRASGPIYDASLIEADLTRRNPDNTTSLIRINLQAAQNHDPGNDVLLARDDVLRVYFRQEVAYIGRRTVTVRGPVQLPGDYTLKDNMRLSDLLRAAGGPTPDAYLNRVVLEHRRGDGTFQYEYPDLIAAQRGDPAQDLPLQDNDVLAIYRVGEEKFTAPHLVTIRGIVVTPGEYPRGEGMRLSELIRAAGGFKPGGGSRVTVAHAYSPQDGTNIQHAQAAMPTATFDPLGKRVTGDDVVLQDGDVVGVQGNGSLKAHPTVVTVTGAVNHPGAIVLTGKMRLSDAVRLAGGLRPEAFAQGAEFSRDPAMLATTTQLGQVSVLTQLNDLLNQSAFRRGLAKSDLDLIQAAQSLNRGSSSPLGLPGASAPAGASATANTVATRLSNRELVSPARILDNSQLQPNGNVTVRLAEALRRPGGSEDIPLVDGDTLIVPETPTTVQVVGAVFRPGGALFKRGQSLDAYVRQVGGYTPDAALDRIEIVHVGGGLIEASKAGPIQPGDLVLVPTKVLAEKLSRGGFDLGNFFQALTGSLLTLRLFR